MRIDDASLRRLCRARDALAVDNAPIRQIARDAGISPFHFIRQFDALFGITPHQFRTNARIERAKQLLRRGRTVTDTCMELGFSSVGSFSQLFMRRVGVAPSEFRRVIAVPAPPTGCFCLMGALPADAFRNFREAHSP